jgi:hypothetical protein
MYKLNLPFGYYEKKVYSVSDGHQFHQISTKQTTPYHHKILSTKYVAGLNRLKQSNPNLLLIIGEK